MTDGDGAQPPRVISAKELGEVYAELDREDIAAGLSPAVIPYGIIDRVLAKIGITVDGRDGAVSVEAMP